jgi:hypothetical protein
MRARYLGGGQFIDGLLDAKVPLCLADREINA